MGHQLLHPDLRLGEGVVRGGHDPHEGGRRRVGTAAPQHLRIAERHLDEEATRGCTNLDIEDRIAGGVDHFEEGTQVLVGVEGDRVPRKGLVGQRLAIEGAERGVGADLPNEVLEHCLLVWQNPMKARIRSGAARRSLASSSSS